MSIYRVLLIVGLLAILLLVCLGILSIIKWCIRNNWLGALLVLVGCGMHVIFSYLRNICLNTTPTFAPIQEGDYISPDVFSAAAETMLRWIYVSRVVIALGVVVFLWERFSRKKKKNAEERE